MCRINRATGVAVKILVRSVLIVGAVASFAACQSANDPAPTPQTPSAVTDAPEADRERLLTRVNEYWQARIQRNMKTAFQYELPTRREQLGEEAYLSRVGLTVKLLEVSIVDIRPSRKETEVPILVQMKYEFSFPVPGAQPLEVDTRITDRWEKDEGIWYHVLDTKPLGTRPREEDASPGPADTL